MRSTMMPEQLNISTILQFGSTVHSDAVVTTWTAEGPRKLSFGDLGKRAAQLAHALRSLGIDGDQRVATFQWNNSEHMEAYLAVPSMGAVLHPLNIRLFPEQLAFVANLAEDNVVNQKVASLLLQRLGYRVDIAANGLEVLEAVTRKEYDVVLMDVQMPEMDGLEATRAIRAFEKEQNQRPVHIVAMTANALAEDRQACALAGMDGFLSKPFKANDLRHMLDQRVAVRAQTPL